MAVEVQLVDRATVKLQALPERMRAALRVALVRDGQLLSARVHENLHGRVLQRHTGRLDNSIKSEMRENPTSIYVRVFSDGSVPYAGIHEYGGTTKPHDIYPKTARALHFWVEGGTKEIFSQHVRHPGSKVPERSYLRSALTELRAELLMNIQQAVRDQAQRWAA